MVSFHQEDKEEKLAMGFFIEGEDSIHLTSSISQLDKSYSVLNILEDGRIERKMSLENKESNQTEVYCDSALLLT